jgi:hypothetical protein
MTSKFVPVSAGNHALIVAYSWRCRDNGLIRLWLCFPLGTSNAPVNEGKRVTELLDTLEMGGIAGDQFQTVM